jgi:plasmid stabilization system protein ParE
MAAKPLAIHPAALAEFKSAVTWYLEQSETAANKFVGELDRAIDLMLAGPQCWPIGDWGTCKFALCHFPYAVIYRERKSDIQVLAIAHGHRQPGYWKDRL